MGVHELAQLAGEGAHERKVLRGAGKAAACMYSTQISKENKMVHTPHTWQLRMHARAVITARLHQGMQATGFPFLTHFDFGGYARRKACMIVHGPTCFMSVDSTRSITRGRRLSRTCGVGGAGDAPQIIQTHKQLTAGSYQHVRRQQAANDGQA